MFIWVLETITIDSLVRQRIKLHLEHHSHSSDCSSVCELSTGCVTYIHLHVRDILLHFSWVVNQLRGCFSQSESGDLKWKLRLLAARDIQPLKIKSWIISSCFYTDECVISTCVGLDDWMRELNRFTSAGNKMKNKWFKKGRSTLMTSRKEKLMKRWKIPMTWMRRTFRFIRYYIQAADSGKTFHH